MTFEHVTFGLRLAAALVWTGVLVLVLRNHWASTYLRRALVTGALVTVLWALVFGGAVALNLVSGDAARFLYSAVATAVLIVGIVLLTTTDERP